jgi:hypothetical protein
MTPAPGPGGSLTPPRRPWRAARRTVRRGDCGGCGCGRCRVRRVRVPAASACGRACPCACRQRRCRGCPWRRARVPSPRRWPRCQEWSGSSPK